ncbi:MAG: sugar phosphate isomerase/epimerase, partial [Clostridia bacterium]|nr:sugar phosphate isomerase/epimerase [Clostridia bacterium]
VQAHSPMGRPIVKNDEQHAFIEGTKLCVKACADLGIENIVVHSGYDSGLSKEETFEKNREFYLEILKYAEAFGVNVLTENFNKMCIPDLFWIDNATDLSALIDYVGHPLFHACFDIGHANLQDMPQHEELAILGEHVKAIHVQDNLGDDDYHLAPFFGTTNFDSVMKGLKRIDYKGYFTFEACNIMVPGPRRRKFEESSLLQNPPIDLKIKAEALIYEIGKTILSAYDMFEE